MIISHKYKFVFIKTMKTAGTSIEVFLSQACGPEDVVTPITPAVEGHVCRNHSGFYNHMPGCAIREKLPHSVWDGYLKFCVERNPWDKVISHFAMNRARMDSSLTLGRYIQEGAFPTDWGKYTEVDSTSLLVDRILRYETLSEDLAVLFKELGIPYQGSLGVAAKSEYRTDRRHYRELLSAEQAGIISRAFSREIALHGYAY